jgi:PucR family transcriptional regulator, purine catabolism regulatory protein
MSRSSQLADLTVRDLLRLEDLAGHEIAAGGAAIDAAVRTVTLTQTANLVQIEDSALIIAALRGETGYEIELLLRRAARQGAAALLLTTAGRLLMSTRRLADRLGIPLLVLPQVDPLDLAWRLAQHVQEPERFAATIVPRLVDELRRSRGGAQQIADAVAKILGASVSVVSGEGTAIVGTLPNNHIDLAKLAVPVPQSLTIAAGHVLSAPAFVEDVRQPDLWIIAQIPSSHSSWVAASSRALSVAATALALWVAGERLRGERNARDRSTVLTDLLDSALPDNAHLAERAVRVGWRINGWHTGIHLRALGEGVIATRFTARINAALAAHGLAGPVVEYGDGWVCWLTADKEPATGVGRAMTVAVREVIADLPGELNLIAGIGRPYPGLTGIGRSLREAREACLFASPARTLTRVEHVDELGIRRALGELYHSEAFHAYARTLFAPLVDSGEDLMETLKVYLDSESSATVTAAALGVHRNTVAYRVRRAEEILSINLSRADERLVVQLASRMLRREDELTTD